jgi:hypothetical protein
VTAGWRKLLNEGFSTPPNVPGIKLRIRWAAYVTQTGAEREIHNKVLIKHKGKKLLGRLRRQHIIKKR